MASATPLEAEIRRLIEVAGPMPLAQYMRLCLTQPDHGYYTTRDPFGAGGDFTTAPEISQMFGELIGLWAAAVWRQMGSPDRVRLVELGPGRGTMMADALRVSKVMRGFAEAIEVHLVEISPTLEQRQREMLADAPAPVQWHRTIDRVPEGPAIILCNEFFDALPVHQCIKRETGWHERVIGTDPDGNLVYGLAADPIPHFGRLLPPTVREAEIGAIFEWRSDPNAFEIGRRLAHAGGAALIIDYGHVESATGDTLQAVGQHAFADPLRDPGSIDLTAHVDFQAIAQAAESMGAAAHGPIAQGEFLRRLGIEPRAAVLKANSSPDKAVDIDIALTRLTAEGAAGMGDLFKVLGLSNPKLGPLPGFDS